MASEPRHSTSLVVVISNHRRRACGNAIPERVEASKRSHMIKSSLADQGRIAMANDVENRLIELMAAGAILDPAIMNNGSSDDVTRMRQAPTRLQYSHRSRSRSDNLASSGCVSPSGFCVTLAPRQIIQLEPASLGSWPTKAVSSICGQ